MKLRELSMLVILALLLQRAQAQAAPSSLSGVSCVTPGTGNATGSDATGNNLICASGTVTWQYPAYIIGSTGAGGSAIACASSTVGAIEWTGSTLQYCNGSAWVTMH